MENQIFNQEKAMAIADNDPDLVRELLQVFYEEKESMLTAISEAIEQQDASKLQLTAHSIKGSLANIGAQQASEVARQLEQCGTESNFEQVSLLFVQLVQEVSQFEEQSRTF